MDFQKVKNGTSVFSISNAIGSLMSKTSKSIVKNGEDV